MSSGIEFEQLKQFQRKLENLKERNLDALCVRLANELAARLLEKVKLKTPVGQYDKPVQFTTKDGKEVSFTPKHTKTGGTLRRNWDVGPIVINGNIFEIWVINQTEYGTYVEYGHRTANHKGWVPGQFFLTTSIEEVQDNMSSILKRRVMEELRRCLHV